LPAEEYEVRDMFLRRHSMGQDVAEYLSKRGYFEPDDNVDFAVNNLTRQLGMAFFTEIGESVLETAHIKVSFVGCPMILEDSIDTGSDEFRKWLDPSKRLYYPPAAFVPYHTSRTTVEGVVCQNHIPGNQRGQLYTVREYLVVNRCGYAEYGYGDGIFWRDHRLVNFIKVVGRFWQFLGFLRDLYRETKLPSSAVVLLNMANVGGAYLEGFGHGWRRISSPIPRQLGGEESLDMHIQLPHELDIAALDEDRIEATVREVAARIGGAFGQDRPRCFNETDARFPEDLFRGYAE
jgi:hypothetical protein